MTKHVTHNINIMHSILKGQNVVVYFVVVVVVNVVKVVWVDTAVDFARFARFAMFVVVMQTLFGRGWTYPSK